jgi:acyl-CoA synthetase (AMP-forming)/AMP-acid ligase II/thioesterase domain-containing protein/acyl carrier protein
LPLATAPFTPLRVSLATQYLEATSVYELMRERVRRAPRATAIVAGSGDVEGIDFSGLLDQVDAVRHALNGWGIGRGDRVATLIPSGPAAALLMLGIASGATYAPLSPRLSQADAAFAFEQLNVRAVVVERGVASPGRLAAEAYGLPIIELAITPDAPAGIFSLTCDRPPKMANERLGIAGADDFFYALQTSGTTARPKVVALRQRQILGATAHSVARLALGPKDRCLHTLSMFHLLGMTTVLFSLMAGMEVVCAGPFDAANFFPLMRRHAPTWFSAPPAVHQSILLHAAEHRDFVARHPLRFVRSAAAALPRRLLREIEAFWQTPLLEAYGMTECPLIASNYAPPGPQRAGSAGVPCGVEVGLIDPEGKGLSTDGATGEIVVRGPHVFEGYADDPAATAAAFIDGWFRTGDIGHFDADGFLFIDGRIKEIINRGGVKITPGEIDDVLLGHPAIAQALTFPMPDERLGEEVAVAAVLKPGAAATELELRQFAAQQLSVGKIPKRVVFVEQLPTGHTGKVQRIGLAEKLGLTSAPATVAAEYVSPRNRTEDSLQSIWMHVLGSVEPISVLAHFMDIGGDSLQAVTMFAEVQRTLDVDLPIVTLLGAPTIAELAAVIVSGATPLPECRMIPIKPGGKLAPLFCIPGMYGNTFSYYALSRPLGDARPIYGVQLPGIKEAHSRDIPLLARRFIEWMRDVQPAGPYHLCGHSFGGYVAFEMAQQLRAAGEAVGLLALFDTAGPRYPQRRSTIGRIAYRLRQVLFGTPAERRDALRRARMVEQGPAVAGPPDPEWRGLVLERSLNGIHDYPIKPFDGRLVLIKAAVQTAWFKACKPDKLMGWGPFAAKVDLHIVPGDHGSMLSPVHIDAVANVLNGYLPQVG